MRFARPLLALGLVSLLAAAGCSVQGQAMLGTQSRQALGARSQFVTAGDISLFVEPEAGVTPIVAAIDGAKRNIDLEIYILTNESVINALIAAAGRGVKVRVMMEPNPFNPEKPDEPLDINRKTALKFKGTGVRYAWTDPAFRFTHSKTMVVDRSTGFIMTLNLSKSGTTKNREFAAIDTDPADVRDLARLFEADWEHHDFKPRSKRLVISPINAQEKLSSLIAGAKKSLVVYDEILYDTSTQDLLGAKAKAGVDVKVLMGDPITVPGNAAAAQRLKDLGVQVKYLDAPVVHAKMIAADGSRGYIGSVNLTANSLLKNREVGIILSEPAHLGVLITTFGTDWANGKDFAPASPLTAPRWPWPVEFDRG